MTSIPTQGRLVLISGRDPLRTSGGNESYLTAHARAAIRAGYEPHVFSVAPRSGTLETDFGILHRVSSPIRPPRSITSVLQRRWLVPAVRGLLRGMPGPHVIHGYGAWADTVIASCRAVHASGGSAMGVATVFMTIEHETAAKLESTVVSGDLRWYALHRLELEWVRRVTVPVERRAYRALDAIIVNYESVRERMQRLYGPGLPIRRLTYSPPTAFEDPPASTPLPPDLAAFGDPAAPLIVSVSRHDGRKGIDVLIHALRGLRQAGVPFRAFLVGPGLLLAAHRRLVKSLGLDDRVLLPGRVPEVMPYLLNADVYVLPSLQEGSGSVAVLEALQAGAAIVASDLDGLPEDLTDDRDALLVTPGDAAALQATIARLIAEPRLRARLGQEARATYERRFAAQVMARELASVYTELGLAPS